MIILESFAPRLAEFVTDGIKRAVTQHPDQQFTSAAVCCCQWTGVLFLALNTGDTDEVLMCRGAADFTVFVDEVSFEEWDREFRTGKPTVQWKGKESGGEGAVFFDFLVTTLKSLFAEHPLPESIRWFGAELHDGTETEYWEVNRDRGQPVKGDAEWPCPLVAGPGLPVFAPEGSMLLIGGTEIQLWNPSTRSREWTKRIQVRANRAVFSYDGTKLAFSEERGRTQVYIWPDFAEISGWDTPADNQGASASVFSPCGQYIIQGLYTQDGEITLAVYETSTGNLTSREKCSGGVLQVLMAARHGELILWAPFIREEQNYYWYLRDWPFVPGEPGMRLPVTFPDQIQRLSPSGKLAVISRFYRGQPKEVQYGLEIVTLPELEPVFVLERCGHRRDGFFDPEERILALAMKGRFEFWDIASRRLLKEVPTKYGYGVYFSPDGQYIALYAEVVQVFRREDLLPG